MGHRGGGEASSAAVSLEGSAALVSHSPSVLPPSPPTSLPLSSSHLFRQIPISRTQLLELFIACLQGRVKVQQPAVILSMKEGAHACPCLCAQRWTGSCRAGSWAGGPASRGSWFYLQEPDSAAQRRWVSTHLCWRDSPHRVSISFLHPSSGFITVLLGNRVRTK